MKVFILSSLTEKSKRKLNKIKIKRKNRKRLPQEEPIIINIYRYNFLIYQTEKMDYDKHYKYAKLRIALILVVLTGIRINTLLPLIRWSIINIIDHNEAFVNKWLEKYFKKIMERF